ncbi:MAG: CPBP family intramembrane metalloprotease [Acidobacteriia bacterium]|nr:CPBP family intramembrane metalloprotease [Terriglobia bacterium]
MSGPQPFEPLGPPPGLEPGPLETPQPLLPPPPRDPFWGYPDLALFLGLLVASVIASLGLVDLTENIFHIQFQAKVAEALAAQSLAYLLSFGALALLFRIHYGRPFWRSIGWISFRVPPFVVILSGASTAIGVAFIGAFIRTPTTSNRITEMLEDPKSLMLVAVFGLTLAPLAEELVFRGFLQPLLVRTLGPAPGIIAAAVPFGLLHFQEYGNSWRHALLISLAGAAFGWMRHRSGSTAASTLMHASYNGLEFLAYFAQQKETHHS